MAGRRLVLAQHQETDLTDRGIGSAPELGSASEQLSTARLWRGPGQQKTVDVSQAGHSGQAGSHPSDICNIRRIPLLVLFRYPVRS